MWNDSVLSVDIDKALTIKDVSNFNRKKQTLFHKIIVWVNVLLAVIPLTFFSFILQESMDWADDPTTGYRPMVVVSGSMIPTMEINSFIMAKGVTIDQVNEGDIIVYNDEHRNMNIVHRVIHIDGDGMNKVLTMKGDNNKTEDFIKVTNDILLGKIVYINNQAVPLVNLLIKDGKVDLMGALIVAFIIYFVCNIVIYILSTVCGFLTSIVIVGKDGKVIRESFENCLIDYNSLGMDYLVDDNDTTFSTRKKRARIYRELGGYKNNLNNVVKAIKSVGVKQS